MPQPIYGPNVAPLSAIDSLLLRRPNCHQKMRKGEYEDHNSKSRPSAKYKCEVPSSGNTAKTWAFEGMTSEFPERRPSPEPLGRRWAGQRQSDAGDLEQFRRIFLPAFPINMAGMAKPAGCKG